MRVAQYGITEVDQYIKEAQRAKKPARFDRWRAELRPHAMQFLTSRAARLTRSRVSESGRRGTLADDLFADLIGTVGNRTDSRDVSGCASYERDRSRSSYADTFPTITFPILRLASAPSRLSAALRPRTAGLTALTGHAVSHVSALT